MRVRESGTGDLGLAHAEEAEAIARDLVAAAPDRHSRLLALVLDVVGTVYAVTGQLDRALQAADESMDLHRAVADEGTRRRRLGNALAIRAGILDLAGRPDEAQVAREEAHSGLDSNS
jgi:ATP/maltotriose-dependent transcriptional regulator MalT